jgi:hypothetical protein
MDTCTRYVPQSTRDMVPQFLPMNVTPEILVKIQTFMTGCTIAQAVRVRAQEKSRGIRGGQNGTGASFLRVKFLEVIN